MLRPNFEPPMDSAQDLVDNNITLFLLPGATIFKQLLENSPIPAYNKLAETTYITKDWVEYDYYKKYNILGNGTHAELAGFVQNYDLARGKWYRSKETLMGKYPYAGYLSNKKWYLNDVNNTI